MCNATRSHLRQVLPTQVVYSQDMLIILPSLSLSLALNAYVCVLYMCALFLVVVAKGP